MNQLLESTDIIGVIKSFMKINEGDDSTEYLILCIGAELLDISVDTMMDLCNGDE